MVRTRGNGGGFGGNGRVGRREGRLAEIRVRRAGPPGAAAVADDWTDTRTDSMVIHMKTTLVIDDGVMRRLKAEAARQGRTISELVETALRMQLDRKKTPPIAMPRLPTFRSRALVDVSDREALYQAMEGR